MKKGFLLGFITPTHHGLFFWNWTHCRVLFLIYIAKVWKTISNPVFYTLVLTQQSTFPITSADGAGCQTCNRFVQPPRRLLGCCHSNTFPITNPVAPHAWKMNTETYRGEIIAEMDQQQAYSPPDFYSIFLFIFSEEIHLWIYPTGTHCALWAPHISRQNR